MNEIFQIIEGVPVITAEGLSVPEMRDLWINDTSENKVMANAGYVFIYHSLDPRSVYRNVDENDREVIVIRDVNSLFFLEGWKPSQEVLAAKEKYNFLITTAGMRYAKSLKRQLDQISKYLDTKDSITSVKEVKEVNTVIKEGEAVLNSIAKADQEAMKDINALSSKTKGNVRINMFDQEEFSS